MREKGTEPILSSSTPHEMRLYSLVPTILVEGDLLILQSLATGRDARPSFWGDPENHRPVKYDRLRKQLEVEAKRWGHISWALRQAWEVS